MSIDNHFQLLAELRTSVAALDIEKTCVVSAGLDNVDEKTQKMALLELSQAPEDFAVKALLALLTELRSAPVQRRAILALGTIGAPVVTTAISEFLYSGNKALREAAVEALGQMGSVQALRSLAKKLGTDPNVDGSILDVFSSSVDREALALLNTTLVAPFAELRDAGKQRLVSLGKKSMPVLQENLRSSDPDLLVHTLSVLGSVGEEAAIPAIRRLLHSEPENANVRFAAYEALGRLPVGASAFFLAQGLLDPVELVRTAAAQAVDHNYNSVLAVGLKNMLRDENGDARPIRRAVIDARCDTVFLDLIRMEDFCAFAVDYLRSSVHPDTRRHFVRLLQANHLMDIASRVESSAGTSLDPRPLAFAVDDSLVILEIYRRVLYNLGCEPVLFEKPAAAIEEARSRKPSIVFTDLNMPEVSGVELTRALRAMYPPHELPIVMVTTQEDSEDDKTARAAGITDILRKPFNEAALESLIERLLPGLSSD